MTKLDKVVEAYYEARRNERQAKEALDQLKRELDKAQKHLLACQNQIEVTRQNVWTAVDAALPKEEVA